jgi:DNA-binding GntR family transcriptional regulator
LILSFWLLELSFTNWANIMRIVRNSLYIDVADRLRAQIFDGALVPGQWLDELKLCDELGISRTPLREAIKVLATEGLVRLEARKGAFVNQVTQADLDDIFPLIAMLEGLSARGAASKAKPADIEKLQALHDKLERYAKARRINEYYETNYQIHEAIIALAGNKWLQQIIADLRKVLRLSRQQQLRVPGRLEQSFSERLSMFAALKAGDPKSAEAAMRTHILRQHEALKQIAQTEQRRSA